MTEINPQNDYILLLHGYLGSVHDFEIVIDEFGRNYNIIGLTIRGHGKTEFTGNNEEETDWSLEALALDLDLVLSQIIPIGQKVAIIASSLSTGMALMFAKNYPKRVESLFLISAANQIPIPIWGSVILNFSKHTPDAFTKFLFNAVNFVIPAVAINQNQRKIRKKATQRVMSIDHKVHTKILNETISSWNIRGEEISAPVFIIAGEDDDVIPSEGAVELNNKLVQSSILIMNQTKHQILNKHPKLVLNLFQLWLHDINIFLSEDQWVLDDFALMVA